MVGGRAAESISLSYIMRRVFIGRVFRTRSLVSDWRRWKYWARAAIKREGRETLNSIFPAYFRARAPPIVFAAALCGSADGECADPQRVCSSFAESVHFININSGPLKWKVRKYRLRCFHDHRVLRV